MTKGVIHSRREKFIKLMVEVNDAPSMIRVYKECFPNCKKDTSAQSACLRMLKDVAIVDGITRLKQEKEEALKKAKQKEIERIAKDQVASETQLDAKLSAIALGEHTRKKKVAVFDPKTGKWHVGTVEVQPDETAMIGAANLLYKRKGSFAEKKIKHEMGDSFIEALKQIKHTNLKKPNNVSA